MDNTDFVAGLVICAGTFILGLVIGGALVDQEYKKILIEQNLGEYKVDAKTGETKFSIFKKENK